MKIISINLSFDRILGSVANSLSRSLNVQVPVQQNVIKISLPYLRGTISALTIQKEFCILISELECSSAFTWKGFFIRKATHVSMFYNLSDNHVTIHNNLGFKQILNKDVKDQLLIVDAQSITQWIPEPNVPLLFFTVLIPKKFIRKMATTLPIQELQGFWADESRVCREYRATGEIRRIIRDICTNCTTANDWEKVYAKGLMYKLTDSILNQHTDAPSLSHNLNMAELSLLAEAKGKLVKDLSAPPPRLETLARMSLMSKSKFKLSFKKIYGMNCYQFYRNQRLEMARQLLLSGRYTVSQAAYEVGYSNLGYFSRAFKLKFNLLPKELVRHHRAMQHDH